MKWEKSLGKRKVATKRSKNKYKETQNTPKRSKTNKHTRYV